MKTLTMLALITLMATSLAACGQRVAPKPPADRVIDSLEY